VATVTLDIARAFMTDAAAYCTVFTLEAVLFLMAALMALQILEKRRETHALQPGE